MDPRLALQLEAALRASRILGSQIQVPPLPENDEKLHEPQEEPVAPADDRVVGYTR